MGEDYQYHPTESWRKDWFTLHWRNLPLGGKRRNLTGKFGLKWGGCDFDCGKRLHRHFKLCELFYLKG